MGLKRHLILYKGPVIPFSSITKSFLRGFHHYLNQAQAGGNVSKHLPDASYTSKLLKRWTQTAGLRKHVTFHVARHTFATLGITYGAELYTISKLLGHSNIRITQIYADIISQKKREAVDSISPIGV